MKTTVQILSAGQRRQIAEASFHLLERVGVQVTEPEAQSLLHGAGVRISGERVYLPGALVEEAIRSAPSHLTLFNRQGRAAFTLGERTAHFGAHVDAPTHLDPFSGDRRVCLTQDAAANAALVDALPQLSFTTATGLVADAPPEVGDRVVLAQCLTSSSKPILAMPLDLASLIDMQAMAALAAGGERALRERPLLMTYAEPLSPLVHPDEALEKVLHCAAEGIPLVYSSFAAMGGTAPLNLAGIVAQLCAETLSGLVIHQLKAPGAPYIFGGMASVMDMRTTVFSYGAPEFQWGNAMMSEMGHHFGLPYFGTAGTSDSQVFDGQALLEATSSVVLASMIGGGLVHDVGLLGSATMVAPEMIVATDEIIAMAGSMGSGLGVEGLPAAVEAIETVGPGGEFVTHDHTFEHFRGVWYPELLYRGGDKAWASEGGQGFEARVSARTRRILETHRPDPLPEAVQEALQAILDRAAVQVS